MTNSSGFWRRKGDWTKTNGQIGFFMLRICDIGNSKHSNYWYGFKRFRDNFEIIEFTVVYSAMNSVKITASWSVTLRLVYQWIGRNIKSIQSRANLLMFDNNRDYCTVSEK